MDPVTIVLCLRMSNMQRPISISAVRQARRAGFTLLELLIVLAILGVIAAMVAPSLLGTQKQAMIKVAVNDISNIETAAKRYAVDHDAEYPNGNDEALNMLVTPTDRDGKSIAPYLEKTPMDPWIQTYHYEYPTTKHKVDKPAIWSSGPNKKNDNGSGDDVKNWEG